MPSPSTRDNAPFRLLTLSAFLAPTLPRLVAKGMFLDGMLYAVIARNMAAGLGSFWKPVLTPTLTADFWAEHPPLGLGIESIFFRVFGDHLWVESLHSLVMAVATAALIIAVWRRVTRGAPGLSSPPAAMEWLPVLAWAMMPQIAWCYSNNMLENTLSVFVLGAVWFLLVAWDARGARAMTGATLGAAACIAAGLFTKGVVALFPLAFLPVVAVVSRGRGRDAAGRTALALAFVCVLVACVLAFDGARENVTRYLDTQFVASLEGKRGAVAHRFGIVRKLVLEMAPPVGCALVVAAIAGWRRRGVRVDDGAGFVAGAGSRMGWAFVVLGLCGSLPLVVSPRQSGFYIVPSFPMFALGIALLAAPAVRALVSRDTPHGRPWTVFTWVGAVLLASILGLSAGRAGAIGRDRTTIRDVQAIGAAVDEGSTVGLCPAMARNWGLHGYFARYYNVSLDAVAPETHAFVVTGKAPCRSLDLSSRDPVALNTETLFLFRRR